MSEADSPGKPFPCYGEFGRHFECRRNCAARTVCRESARAGQVEAAFHQAGQYAELVPAPEAVDTVDGDELKYSHEDLLKLIDFFMVLSSVNFMALKIRMRNAELSVPEIADLLGLKQEAPIHGFFLKLCSSYPTLYPMLYPDKVKINPRPKRRIKRRLS